MCINRNTKITLQQYIIHIHLQNTFFLFFFFFFNDTATTEIYTSVHTLSLHDALPITGRQTASATRASRSSPWGGPYGRLDGVSYTGPNTTQSAPFSSASTASSRECVDTPIRSRLSATARMSWMASDVEVRWTASAPTASATSTRSLTIRSASRSSVS